MMTRAGSNPGADSRQALAVAAELAECRRPGDLEAPLLSTLELVGADAIGSGDLHYGARRAPMDILPQIAYPEIFDAEALGCWAAHWPEHPVLVRQLRGSEPSPLRLSDSLSQRRLRRLGIYAAYRRLGLRGEISLQVEWEPGRVACVSMHRTGRDFGERELDLLGLLAPHLRAARTRIVLAMQARRRRAMLERGLEESGVGVVLVDGSGRIAAISGGAREALGRWFPAAAADRLPAEVDAWLTDGRGEGGPRPLLRSRPGHSLEVTASGGPAERTVILRERSDASPCPEELERSLPLTRRQAEVLALVSLGHGDAAIAGQLGISVRTVGHHVEQVLARLGVPSRTAAAAVALRRR